jgi:enoyl-[acyl-carrier protein] reductase I
VKLAGKNVVVLGVADEGSIAWAIARAFHAHGARVWIGYQQKFFSRVRLLLRQYGDVDAQRCDVTDEAELSAFFSRFDDHTPIDVLVHAIAYAAPQLFTQPPSATRAEMFAQSQQISALSLATVIRHAKPRLREWASIITLTSEASERALPMYGLMGVAKSALESLVRYLAVELGEMRVRVNAILAGPIETPAAMGVVMAFLSDPDRLRTLRNGVAHNALRAAREAVGDNADEVEYVSAAWKHVQRTVAERSAIRDVISAADVADCALFLGSDYSRKITGQVLRVDCGSSSALII